MEKFNLTIGRLMRAEHELISRRAKLLHGTIMRAEIFECRNCFRITTETYCKACHKTLQGFDGGNWKYERGLKM